MIETRHGAVNLRRFGDGPVQLVALHGFTQHGGAFEELASLLGFGVLAVDLPGHGKTEVIPVDLDVAVRTVAAVLEPLEKPPPLLGYSQGGRVALRLALTSPGLIDRLVLVSTSPGLEDSYAREQRRVADEALADRLEDIGLESFVDEWLALDMFAGLQRRSPEWRSRDRLRRLENTAGGLAAALRGMGQGVQPYLGDDLGRLVVPLLAVAGGDDPGYVSLAGAMVSRAPDAVLEVIPGSGHAVTAEDPVAVADLVRRFIGETTESSNRLPG